MQERRIFRGHTGTISTIVFSPDGLSVLTASDDHTARLWDAATGKELAVLAHDKPVKTASFSPDGARIVTAGEEQNTRIWDCKNGKPVAELSDHEDGVESATFSPDGKRILTVWMWYHKVEIWDAEELQLLATFSPPEGYNVTTAVLSPDGKEVALGVNDGRLQLWDIGARQLVKTFRHQSGINSIEFSPDGQRIITASNDDTAVVWHVEKGSATFVLHHADRVETGASSAPHGGAR